MSEFEQFEIRTLPPFAEGAKRLLTDEQIHQIKRNLAANPFVGEPVDEVDTIFRYRFEQVDVYYRVTADLNRLYLLAIAEVERRSRLDRNRIGKKIGSAGKRWIGREIYYRIREFLSENPPWDWF